MYPNKFNEKEAKKKVVNKKHLVHSMNEFCCYNKCVAAIACGRTNFECSIMPLQQLFCLVGYTELPPNVKQLIGNHRIIDDMTWVVCCGVEVINSTKILFIFSSKILTKNREDFQALQPPEFLPPGKPRTFSGPWFCAFRMLPPNRHNISLTAKVD